MLNIFLPLFFVTSFKIGSYHCRHCFSLCPFGVAAGRPQPSEFLRVSVPVCEKCFLLRENPLKFECVMSGSEWTSSIASAKCNINVYNQCTTHRIPIHKQQQHCTRNKIIIHPLVLSCHTCQWLPIHLLLLNGGLPRFSGSLSHYPWHCVWNGACHESGYYTPKCFHCIRCPQCVGWSWLCNRDLTRSSDIRVMCIYISTDTVSLTKAEPEPGLKDDAPTNSFRQTNRFYVRHLVRVLVPNPNQWCCFRLIPLPIAYNYGDVNLIISPGPPAHLVGYYGRRVIIIIVVGGD